MLVSTLRHGRIKSSSTLWPADIPMASATSGSIASRCGRPIGRRTFSPSRPTYRLLVAVVGGRDRHCHGYHFLIWRQQHVRRRGGGTGGGWLFVEHRYVRATGGFCPLVSNELTNLGHE